MNIHGQCLPCEAAARNVALGALTFRTSRQAGYGVPVRSVYATQRSARIGALSERQRQTYGLIGGLALVGLWGAAFWWITR